MRASVGLQVNLPIDRLRERNSYRATLVNFEAQLRSLTLTLDNLKESIERGLRTLEQRRQNYEIQKNALQLANRRVQSTTLLLEAGRAEVRDLVDAQDCADLRAERRHRRPWWITSRPASSSCSTSARSTPSGPSSGSEINSQLPAEPAPLGQRDTRPTPGEQPVLPPEAIPYQ